MTGSTPAAPQRPPVPPRPPRDVRLDIVRGLLQLTIFASHATGTWIGVWLIPSPWGLSDSSEQFVFLSGLTLGSVFARKAVRDGFGSAWGDLLRRTWRLYRTHLTVFALYGLAVVVAGATLLPGEAERMGWGPLLAHPLAHLPSVLLTLDQPAFMGILPLFIWCMLLLPGFAAAEARFGDLSLALPLGVYAAAWAVMAVWPGRGWEDGIGFNPFTWQLVFLTGAWLGRRALLHGRALPFAAPWARGVTLAAVAVLAAGLLLRLGWHGFIGGPVLPAFDWLTDKKDLAPGRLLHALALAWLIAALVPRDAAWMHGAFARWLGRIGRHSLSVFCIGLFASWGASVVFRMAPALPLLDPAVIGAGFLVLGGFAWWRERQARGTSGSGGAGNPSGSGASAALAGTFIQSALFPLYWDLSYSLAFGLAVLSFAYASARASERAGAVRRPFITATGWVVIEATLIVLALAHCAFYLALPNYADYGEPVIPLLAGNLLHGAAVYADWTAGQAITGSNYGPIVFLAQLPVLLWQPSIWASKLVGIGFGVAGVALLATAVRARTGRWRDALALCAVMVCLLSFEFHSWFWNRPDPILVALAALGVLLFERLRPTACLVALAALAALAINCKVFGGLYLLPLVLATLPRIAGWSARVAACAVGGGLFAVLLAAPFALGVGSLAAYLGNLALMPQQGFDLRASLVAENYGLTILALPLLTWWQRGVPRGERTLAIGLLVCAALVGLVAGKPGGGTAYMMPLIPLSLYLVARAGGARLPSQRRVLVAAAICAAPVLAHSWLAMSRQLADYRTELAKAEDLRRLFVAFPDAQMGHNSGPAAEADEFFRVSKAFLGQVTRFDYVNFSDQRGAGVSAAAVYPLLERCSVPTWIVSRQGERLGGLGFFGRKLFDEGAMQRFASSYRLAVRTDFYEVWRCCDTDAANAGQPPLLR